MRENEETIRMLQRVYANVAVKLESMLNFKDWYKDTVTASVVSCEVSEIREALGLHSEDFIPHLTLLKRQKRTNDRKDKKRN